MKQVFSLKIVFAVLLLAFSPKIFAQQDQFPDYRCLKDGNWSDFNSWEQNNGTGWGGAPGLTGPGKNNNVFIQFGHTITINANTAECNNLSIDQDNTLNSSTASPGFYSLRPGSKLDSRIGTPAQIINDGILGSATPGGNNDGISLEIPYNCNALELSGAGVTNIFRIAPFMSGVGFIRGMNFTFDQDVTTSGPFTAYANTVNNQLTDSIAYNIMAGRTVKVNGYFHSNSATATNSAGKYIYNVDGTLDLSASNSPSYIPAITGSVTTLNITGTLILGSQGLTVGSGNIVNLNGGVIDATATIGLLSGTAPFTITNGATVKRTVGATDVNFPVATTAAGFNPVTLNNTGTQDVFTVSVKDGFDFTMPSTYSVKVNKQWTITEGTSGGSSVIVKLGWITADQDAGFNPTGSAGTVKIIRYNGSAWEEIPATVTGSGTLASPYVATSNNPVVAFSPFGVVYTGTVQPVTISNQKAFQKNNGIQVEWTSAAETNLSKYIVEKSANGIAFTETGTVNPTGNSSAATVYTWYDATPNTGNNFYRIKVVNKDGSSRYTSIMKVATGKGKTDFVISPNPVFKANLVTLQLNNFTKGTYYLNLYSSSGQKVLSKQMIHPEGSASEVLQLPASVKDGIYSMQIKGDNFNMSKSIIIK